MKHHAAKKHMCVYSSFKQYITHVSDSIEHGVCPCDLFHCFKKYIVHVIDSIEHGVCPCDLFEKPFLKKVFRICYSLHKRERSPPQKMLGRTVQAKHKPQTRKCSWSAGCSVEVRGRLERIYVRKYFWSETNDSNNCSCSIHSALSVSQIVN